MTKEMLDLAELLLVSPSERDRDLQDQLVAPQGMDKVHPVEGLDGLLRYRLGGEDANKRCFALVGQENGQRRVLSAIYTHWSCPERDDEKPWRILPGRVDQILAEESRDLDGPATVVTFYSISSFVPFAGKALISRLYLEFAKVRGNPVMTTLSPLRTLQDWLVVNQLTLDGTEEARLQTVARYLSQRKDPVQRFHLGNGAQVGAIHFNANAPGTADDVHGAGCMISYRYPRVPGRLQENLGILSEERIPVSYHLAPYFVR